MSTPAPQATTPEQALAWEAEHRTRAAAGSIAAGILTLLGSILTTVGFNGIPDYAGKVVTPIDTLGHLVAGTTIPQGRGALQVLYLADHATVPIAGAIIQGLGGLLLFLPASYLFMATKARNPTLLKLTLFAAAAGAAMYGIGTAASGIARYSAATGLAADATNADAVDALKSGGVLIGAAVQQLGGFLLGFTFVMLGLNAMRVGLMTRFMGILGVITGATFVLPLDQQGILRSFWLVALGFLLAGRWPSVIPAWETGRPQPWPTAQQLRERRDGAGEVVPATPAPAPRAPSPNASKKKRKRK